MKILNPLNKFLQMIKSDAPTPLADLIKIYGNFPPSEKFKLGYVEGFYEGFLRERQDEISNLLEIGVCGGKSLKLWSNYFPTTTSIYAIEIVGRRFEEQSIKNIDKDRKSPLIKIIGDAYKEEIMDTLENNFFDLIIDDGDHKLESQQTVIDKYYSKLKPGGSLVIENILIESQCQDLAQRASSKGFTPSCINTAPYLQEEAFANKKRLASLKSQGIWLLHLIK